MWGHIHTYLGYLPPDTLPPRYSTHWIPYPQIPYPQKLYPKIPTPWIPCNPPIPHPTRYLPLGYPTPWKGHGTRDTLSPPVNRMTDRRLWKHYLPSTTVVVNIICILLRHLNFYHLELDKFNKLDKKQLKIKISVVDLFELTNSWSWVHSHYHYAAEALSKILSNSHVFLILVLKLGELI